MKHALSTPIFVLLSVALVLGACAQPRTWDPQNPPDPEQTASGLTKRIVIFAPVDASMIAEEYPDASVELARSMAQRTDLLVSNVEAWVGETLPLSSDPRWNKGPLGAASGAHNVVTTTLVDLETRDGIGQRPGRITATVMVRLFNVAGEQVWANEFRGYADDKASPRFMADSSKPVAKATWDACDTAMWGLKRWFDAQGAPGDSRLGHDAPIEDQQALIDVEIGSIPPNADIFVDGIFRGNTPTVVPLPIRTMTIRVERAGYTPWEREVKPSPDMRIEPALLPLQGRDGGNALPLPGEKATTTADRNPAAVIERPLPPRAQPPANEEPAAPEQAADPAPEDPVSENANDSDPVDELEDVELPPVE